MTKSTFIRKAVASASALALAGTLAACGGGDDGKSITIGYIGWDEAVAATHLWSAVLEEEGYDVEMKELDAGLIFEGLSNGDVDFFLDGWLPTTHKSYMDKYGDTIETIGVWYDNASLSIAVPEYVTDVNSLEDLAGASSEFGGEIIGIEDSAGLTEATREQVMPTYGLEDMDLVTSTTAVMLSQLDTSIANNEPIVVTLWHPHWAYAKYDLKDLEDPEGTLGESEEITTLARPDFSSDQPEITAMLKKFKMDDKSLGDLEDYLFNQNPDDYDKGVEEWLKANPDFVKSLK